jgi:tRNA (guanine37-N1)-methyltransferase
LISGNHQKIEAWRQEASIISTLQKRPDLIQGIELTDQEKKMLKKLGFPGKQ